ncbi:unnamed protein product [Ambrosiozyma monospora]|uniref:Unnamed protein product n=1 Tax=Ambrosiozyma monospora TaxID=43982 RepID=A0ACB5UBJ1_AMBMO|nr:unnamed protein product [Ambrosiozyma monospora]
MKSLIGHSVMVLLFNGLHDQTIPSCFNRLRSSWLSEKNVDGHDDESVKFLGITPNYNDEFNNYDFPILLDEGGHIAKQLKLLDPLGGCVFPLTSVVAFDSQGVERARLKLGYDYGHLYDDSEDNNLQSQLLQLCKYLDG